MNRLLMQARVFAGMALVPSALLAQTPPKVEFTAQPLPKMGVHLNGNGSAIYLPDRLIVQVRSLRLSNVAQGADVTVESLGVEVYLGERSLGKGDRVPVRKALPQGGELHFENVELTVPMQVPNDDFTFFLIAYLPSDAFWITRRIEMPGMVRMRKPPTSR